MALPMRPAAPLSIENAAMMAGIARVNICTSMASSPHPAKQAQKVVRSTGVP